MRNPFQCAVALSLVLFGLIPGFSPAAETIDIDLAGQRVTLEVAKTAEQQRTGLMHRSTLKTNHGMLFVFDAPRPIAMWMKNTLIDLDAAFVDPCGRILNIETMKRETLDLHRSQGNALTVIEMSAGWFSQHKIRQGDIITKLRSSAYCRQ